MKLMEALIAKGIQFPSKIEWILFLQFQPFFSSKTHANCSDAARLCQAVGPAREICRLLGPGDSRRIPVEIVRGMGYGMGR